MTEMLGVLAVIGVLTVTALMGYNYGINKHRSNDTIKEVSERAVMAASQLINSQSLIQDEMGPTTRQGYPVKTLIYVDDPQFFDIEISNVSQGVCEQILRSDWTSPAKIEVNDKWYRGDINICEEHSKILFIFNKDLDADVNPPKYCEQNSQCSGCDMCDNNMCISRCADSEKCARDSEIGTDVCCPSEKYAGGLCCPSTVSGLCCNASGRCCPSYRPLVDKNGNCHACDANYLVDVGTNSANCAVCPNRIMTGGTAKTLCMLPCGQGIYKNKPLTNASGGCHACDETKPFAQYHLLINTCTKICPNRYVHNSWFCAHDKCGEGIYKDKKLSAIYGDCHSCDIEAAIYTTKAFCSACPDRKYVGSACIKPCPEGYFNSGLTGNEGTGKGCFSCDEPNPVPLYLGDVSLCAACPNRTIRKGDDWAWANNTQCVIDCGTGIYKDKPLIDRGAKCFSCDITSAISVFNTSDCDICPNRHMEGDKCMLDCPSDKPLMDNNGVCYMCESVVNINVGGRTEACKICPNRIISSNSCILPCGQGVLVNKPLMQYNGICLACDTKAPVFMGAKEDCAACPNRELITSTNGTNYFCSNPCPSDKPLQDTLGTCHACDTDSTVYIDWSVWLIDTCRVCPNREIVGKYCVKK